MRVLFQDVWNMWFKMASSEISTNSRGNDRVTLLYSINMKFYGYDKCKEFSCKSGTLLFDTYIVG